MNHEDYENCFVSNPISVFIDGSTSFEFDRHGYFYFISGEPGHCEAGQKLVVRVMVHPRIVVRGGAPAESPTAQGPAGDDGWGSFGWDSAPVNSTDKLAVASYFMTTLLGVFIVLYLFV